MDQERACKDTEMINHAPKPHAVQINWLDSDSSMLVVSSGPKPSGRSIGRSNRKLGEGGGGFLTSQHSSVLPTLFHRLTNSLNVLFAIVLVQVRGFHVGW